MKAQIVFTVDNGEEFGGKSWMKIKELRKLIGGFGCHLIQNHKGHCEENAHLERSHRTDDDEFYIPRVMKIKSEAELLDEAMGYPSPWEGLLRQLERAFCPQLPDTL